MLLPANGRLEGFQVLERAPIICLSPVRIDHSSIQQKPSFHRTLHLDHRSVLEGMQCVYSVPLFARQGLTGMLAPVLGFFACSVGAPMVSRLSLPIRKQVAALKSIRALIPERYAEAAWQSVSSSLLQSKSENTSR